MGARRELRRTDPEQRGDVCRGLVWNWLGSLQGLIKHQLIAGGGNVEKEKPGRSLVFPVTWDLGGCSWKVWCVARLLLF